MDKPTIKEFKNNQISLKDLKTDSKIYFMGLGGIGMSAIARILMQAGYKISGSDLNKNYLMEYFEKEGAEVFTGHSADNLTNCSVVVRSSAIKEDNPEYIRAVEKTIPIVHRAEMLRILMSEFGKTSVGVTGTHGKTTTTGMIASIFHNLGLDPSFAIGGEIPGLKTNSAYGKGEHFISELDESDGTIELYSPEISIITNLELEHADHYKDGFTQLLETFERFIKKIKETSKIIVNIDDVGNLKLLERINADNVITYSIKSDKADYYASIIETAPAIKFNVYKNNQLLGKIKAEVHGEHNVSNALAAVVASLECGLEFQDIARVFAEFSGMKKRFQTVGFANGARIIDDYAHHPTEIRAAVKTARRIVDIDKTNKGRVVAVFQPHRYTRLEKFWNEFLNSFNDADVVYVCDVYSAEEKPIEDINSEKFVKQLKNNSSYHIKGSIEEVADELSAHIRANDLVLTMGAGTITKLGPSIVNKINGDSRDDKNFKH